MDSNGQHVREVTSADFATAVLQRSHEVPVVVDFWAEWCGPCKVLGPLLEKAAEDRGGDFELAKIDVDQDPQLAAQFGVQGIPTVVGFRDGAPVARFTGAVPDTALQSWLDELLPSELDAKVDAARGAALAGDVGRAETLYREVLQADPVNQDAGMGLAALLIAGGHQEEALELLGRLSPTQEVTRLQAAARLSAAQPGDIAELQARVERDPHDPATRLDLAQALATRGEFEPALDHLLNVVRAKGEKVDEARLAMLDVFGVLGDAHPLTQAYRRQLASALF